MEGTTVTSGPSSYVPIREAKWWLREPPPGPGGAAARPERTSPLRAADLSSRSPAQGPQPGPRLARGLRPREVWRQGPRDYEELRHHGPLRPAPEPQASLQPRLRLPGGPRKGGR